MRTPFGLSRINAYVGFVALLGAAAAVGTWYARPDYPGTWGLFVLGLVSFLLEVSSTRLRGGGAEGSISFVIHLAAFVLFGPYWAVLVVTASTLAGQIFSRRPPTRIVFNTSQRVLSIALAAVVYYVAGGGIPLSLFQAGAAFEIVLRDLGAFLFAVVVYILINSLAVSGAVGISTGRSFLDVWRTNTLWVLGYDVAATSLSLLVAWLYTVFDSPDGITRFGFLAIFLPIVAAKHIYGKLNSLQHLYGELDEAYARLEENVREQLAMMVKSIEARDPYTSGHSRRVAALSHAIAVDYGLSDEIVAEVDNAALLHDVGKIHAEFAPLLSKEGKLTPEEWELMKTHSVKSAELVGLFRRFHGEVQSAVRSHHERWDGLGYPDGLSGAQIPLGARIIMIADTIDAMTTDRPYRKALSFDVVVAELNKYRGTQFDPKLVDAVVSSVSVRRLASRQDIPADADPQLRRPKWQAEPIRSYGNLFTGRRLGTDRS